MKDWEYRQEEGAIYEGDTYLFEADRAVCEEILALRDSHAELFAACELVLHCRPIGGDARDGSLGAGTLDLLKQAVNNAQKIGGFQIKIAEAEDFDEIHYAPIGGGCQFMRDGQELKPTEWSEFNRLLAVFLVEQGKMFKLVRTINYGHPLFHGHQGRVDIYKKDTDA